MSRVQYNFRVLRDDGTKISAREVFAALVFFVNHKREPQGYRIEAINWSYPSRYRPGKRGRHTGVWRVGRPVGDGSQDMREHFWHILTTQGIEALRLGGVKRDRL